MSQSPPSEPNQAPAWIAAALIWLAIVYALAGGVPPGAGSLRFAQAAVQACLQSLP